MRPLKSTLGLELLERREMLHGGEIFPSVTIETQQGSITIELFHDDAPATVQNFLNYVHDGDYQDMIFHRLVPGFVLQGGGFTVGEPDLCGSPCNVATADISTVAEVPTDPPVVNEFGRSNIRGTVAMAKLGNDPNSATSQFFVNLSNNSANLDAQNGGFTVFGQVVDMQVVDEIATLSTVNLSSRFTNLDRRGAIVAAPTFVNGGGRTEIVNTQSLSGTAVLEGTVFNDFDGDGSRDQSDGGMFRRTVFDDANGNGVLDNNETSTLTDERGQFHLVVSPGNYDVRLVAGTDYGQTISVPNGAYDRTVAIGEEAASLDFGMRYTGTSWQNPLINTDVDGVNGTTPLDALAVINELDLREFSSAQTGALPALESTPASPVFLDVVGNGAVGPLDANFVITNLISTTPASAVPRPPLSAMYGSVSADAAVEVQVPAAHSEIDQVDRREDTQTSNAGLQEVSTQQQALPSSPYRASDSLSHRDGSGDKQDDNDRHQATDDVFAALGGSL